VCDGVAHYDAAGGWLGLCAAGQRKKANEARGEEERTLLRELQARDEKRLRGIRRRLEDEARRLPWKHDLGIGIDSFRPERDQGGADALGAARRFVRNPLHLLLHGDPGTGKTGLLFAIREAMMARGVPAIYLSAEEWRTWLRARDSFNREVAEPAEWWLSAIEHAPVVLLDELAAREADARNDVFPAAVANWFDRSAGRMAIATNATVAELRGFGVRWSQVADRLQGMAPVELRGDGARAELGPSRPEGGR